jgi:hypothetical protein
MKSKLIIIKLAIVFLLIACSDKADEEYTSTFYIEQDGRTLSGTSINIKKAPFKIASTQKDFSIVIAKNPIRNLADHKEIVKLTGTTGAWYLGQLPFYQRSDLLSDRNACLAYYGHEGEGCQEYIREKTRLGFKLHYAYTFAEYFVDQKSVTLIALGNKKIESLASGKYYLYLFRSEYPMGKVARSQRVTRMTLNLQ